MLGESEFFKENSDLAQSSLVENQNSTLKIFCTAHSKSWISVLIGFLEGLCILAQAGQSLYSAPYSVGKPFVIMAKKCYSDFIFKSSSRNHRLMNLFLCWVAKSFEKQTLFLSDWKFRS